MLNKTVVENGFCIGCGACAVSGVFQMHLNEEGQMHAFLKNGVSDNTDPRLCPFSDHAPNQDELAQLFLSDQPHFHPHLGRFSNRSQV